MFNCKLFLGRVIMSLSTLKENSQCTTLSINNRTKINGCAITAEILLRKVDNVLGNTNNYNLKKFFDD
jgi:hypothetical protein